MLVVFVMYDPIVVSIEICIEREAHEKSYPHEDVTPARVLYDPGDVHEGDGGHDGGEKVRPHHVESERQYVFVHDGSRYERHDGRLTS